MDKLRQVLSGNDANNEEEEGFAAQVSESLPILVSLISYLPSPSCIQSNILYYHWQWDTTTKDSCYLLLCQSDKECQLLCTTRYKCAYVNSYR